MLDNFRARHLRNRAEPGQHGQLAGPERAVELGAGPGPAWPVVVAVVVAAAAAASASLPVLLFAALPFAALLQPWETSAAAT